MNMLNNAISLAVDKQGEQTDKAGEPYIFHLFRVMLAVKEQGEEHMTVSIYLTQWREIVQNFFAVTGLFAIFLLLSACAYATRTETGYASVFSTHAALTTNHLPLKGDSWLLTSVHVPARDANEPDSPKLRARLLNAWNSCPEKAGFPSASCFKTELFSASTLNLASRSSLNYQTGKQAITNPSNAGEQFTVSDFSNIKPEPAERRVLPFLFGVIRAEKTREKIKAIDWRSAIINDMEGHYGASAFFGNPDNFSNLSGEVGRFIESRVVRNAGDDNRHYEATLSIGRSFNVYSFHVKFPLLFIGFVREQRISDLWQLFLGNFGLGAKSISFSRKFVGLVRRHYDQFGIWPNSDSGRVADIFDGNFQSYMRSVNIENKWTTYSHFYRYPRAFGHFELFLSSVGRSRSRPSGLFHFVQHFGIDTCIPDDSKHGSGMNKSQIKIKTIFFVVLGFLLCLYSRWNIKIGPQDWKAVPALVLGIVSFIYGVNSFYASKDAQQVCDQNVHSRAILSREGYYARYNCNESSRQIRAEKHG